MMRKSARPAAISALLFALAMCSAPFALANAAGAAAGGRAPPPPRMMPYCDCAGIAMLLEANESGRYELALRVARGTLGGLIP